MFARLAIVAPLLLGQLVAANANDFYRVVHGFTKRQSDSEAFIPGTTPGCPDDWPICGSSNICYDPSQGDTCCPSGTYACPGGSFCLVDPYCCPEGLDPATCAQQYGVSLPPASSSTPPLVITPTATPSSSSIPSSTPAPPPASSAPVPPTSVPINGTTPTGSVTVSPSNPLFTGAASRNVAGGAAMVLGGLGLLQNILIL